MRDIIIPYSRQYIDKSDLDSVQKVLNSDFLTTGPIIKKFEKSLSKYCNAKFSIATNSATSALHIACMAIGLKKNDYVWTSPISFVASANCALYCGSKVDFVDIDLSTFNISITKLREKLIKAKNVGKLPKVIIPVHLAGQACEMSELKILSKKYKFKIIEDASHAIGGKYKNSKIGSCKYSDITVFSFHPVKIITSAEGGAALTNNKKFADRMRQLREHGIEKNKNRFVGRYHGPWFYQQKSLGYNYRLSDIHSALGLNQLKKVDEFVKKRNLIFNYYKKKLKNLPIYFQEEKKYILSSKHLVIVLVPKKDHLNLFRFLRKKNIFVNLHYIPIYLHPYYKKQKFKTSSFKNSNLYYSRALSLPVYFKLSKKNQDYVINLVIKFFKKKK